MKKETEYHVKKIDKDLIVNADWNKPDWQQTNRIEINSVLGDTPVFVPKTHAKIMYNVDYLFVIFKIADKYVRSTTNKINGPVWEDSCVEIFFAPDSAKPLQYFNLEINCGGTPLMYYNIKPRIKYEIIPPEEIKTIEIAAVLPEVVDPAIQKDTTWFIEYKIPFELLQKYSDITKPSPGVEWKANLYKTASNNGNPHNITWAPIDSSVIDFHLPQFFGTLVFD